MPTDRYDIDLIAENQPGASVLVNEGFTALDDAAGQGLENEFTAQNHFTGTPPASSTEALVEIGNKALVGMAAGGTFLGGNIQSGYTGDVIRLLLNDAQIFRLGGGGAVEAGRFAASGGMRGLNGGWALGLAVITPPSDANFTVAAADYVMPMLSLATGAWTTGRQVILPNTTGGLWIVSNNTPYTATFKTAAGTGINVSSSRRAWLSSTGVNIIRASPEFDPSV